MKAKKKIAIDSTAGGNGDIWMRLASLYSMASLLPEMRIQILVPPFIRSLARFTFGDRLDILEDSDKHNVDLIYSSLGFLDLLKGIIRGRRYISPYQRAVVHDRKKRRLKDVVNNTVFTAGDILGVIQVPARKWITVYQGYLDIIGIKKFRKVSYADYKKQLQLDYTTIYKRLNNNIPVSKELVLPPDISENIIVFPTGTSRQFVPVWWASKYLPNAYYAFFFKDKEAEAFKQNGLKTLSFYGEPGDIIYMAQAAKWAISTDSFPSHLLQYSSEKSTITITEVLKSRIISPVFKGKVIDAEVKCHPCLHLDRKNHPTCAAGYTECLNWKSNLYTSNLLSSLPV